MIYKLKFKKILLLVVFFSLVLILPAQGQEEKDYYYQTIKVDITIKEDSTFDVREEQTYRLNDNFGFFYRKIGLKDTDHISDLKVYDSDNNLLSEEQYKTAFEGRDKNVTWNFARRDFEDELKSWAIEYRVHGGLRFFKEHDELYWNAVFAGRSVPVAYAETIVHLPQAIDKDQLQIALYLGSLGSSDLSENYQILDEQTIKYWAYNLEAQEFMTVAVGWPKGIVAKPLLYRNQTINLLAIIIALAFFLFNIASIYKQWLAKGKDPKMKRTVIAQYKAPEKLSPAIVGVILNQRVDVKDITAVVVDLAVKGYLKIYEGKKTFFLGQEYIFEKV